MVLKEKQVSTVCWNFLKPLWQFVRRTIVVSDMMLPSATLCSAMNTPLAFQMELLRGEIQFCLAVCRPERVFEQPMRLRSEVHQPIWRICLRVSSRSQRRSLHWLWSPRPLSVQPLRTQCSMPQRRRNLPVSIILSRFGNHFYNFLCSDASAHRDSKATHDNSVLVRS